MVLCRRSQMGTQFVAQKAVNWEIKSISACFNVNSAFTGF